jgi:RNA polymerase sigma-70 factor (ECF subfamily)
VEPNDEELVERARDGDRDAFETLIRRYDRLVFRVVAGFGGDREDTLDLTQTVFLKAWSALGGFRQDASFKTWLLRIAHHEALNRIRTAGRRPLSTELDPESPAFASAPEQESDLLARERSGCLKRALAALHGRYRTAILLRYRDGLPIREIAGVLEVSETMTKNLLFRGVRQLRRALAEAS